MCEVKKMIIITDCMECPKIGKCDAWEKLTPKEKFTLKTGIGIGKFILKDCALEDVSNTRENKGLMEKPLDIQVINKYYFLGVYKI